MSKKRRAETQLTRDNFEDERDDTPKPGQMLMATPEEIAKRKIYKLKKPEATPEPTGTGGLFAGISTSISSEGAQPTEVKAGFASFFDTIVPSSSATASTTTGTNASPAPGSTEEKKGGFGALFAAPKPVEIEPRSAKVEEKKGTGTNASTAPGSTEEKKGGVGSLFAAPKPVEIEPRTAKTEEKTGGFGAFASFAAPKPVEIEPRAAKTNDTTEKGGKAEVPATAGFSFTSPPACGTKFDEPSVGLFPPLRNNFDSLTSFAAPKITKDTQPAPAGTEASGFTSLAKDENQMSKVAKLNEKTEFQAPDASSPDSDKAKVFTPAPPTFIQPEAAKLLESTSEQPKERVTGEEGDVTLFTMAGVMLKESKKEGGGWAERGTGLVKINKRLEGGSHRLLMWRDSTHQVLLNERISPSTFTLPATEPTARAMVFVVMDEGTVRTLSFIMKKGASGETDIRNLHAVLQSSLEEAATKSKVKTDQ